MWALEILNYRLLTSLSLSFFLRRLKRILVDRRWPIGLATGYIVSGWLEPANHTPPQALACAGMWLLSCPITILLFRGWKPRPQDSQAGLSPVQRRLTDLATPKCFCCHSYPSSSCGSVATCALPSKRTRCWQQGKALECARPWAHPQGMHVKTRHKPRFKKSPETVFH